MEMRFSSLIDHLGGTKNPLYLQLEEHRAKDTPVVDLVKGNVNEHGIVFPEDTLREILAEVVPPGTKRVASKVPQACLAGGTEVGLGDPVHQR